MSSIPSQPACLILPAHLPDELGPMMTIRPRGTILPAFGTAIDFNGLKMVGWVICVIDNSGFEDILSNMER